MCLCAALPKELITLHGKPVILQHPMRVSKGNRPRHEGLGVHGGVIC